MGELGHKWIGCVITHLSIYDPFIYKLITHYQPNLYIYIKPKPLKLPQFSTSSF